MSDDEQKHCPDCGSDLHLQLKDEAGYAKFWFVCLNDRFAYDDRTVLDYDRFFLQFGLAAQGVGTFGSPFVQVYGGRPKDDA